MNERKALIIYHRVDFDGLCTLSIATLGFKTVWKIDTDYLGWNYGDELPDFNEIYNKYTDLFIGDLSFPPEIMISIKEKFTGNHTLTWIDHHEVSINLSIENGYNNISGIREIGIAACELTWKFFFPEQIIPQFVVYLGIYDSWRKNDVSEDVWENIIIPLQSGLKYKIGLKPEEWINQFTNILCGEEIIYDILNIGTVLSTNQDKMNQGNVNRFAFPVKVAGQYNGICMLGTIFSSRVFKSVMNDYDIYIVCNRIDHDKYSLSMYKEPDRLPEFSCGGYLHSLNPSAGGHRGAAGITLNLEQFIKLIQDCEI